MVTRVITMSHLHSIPPILPKASHLHLNEEFKRVREKDYIVKAELANDGLMKKDSVGRRFELNERTIDDRVNESDMDVNMEKERRNGINIEENDQMRAKYKSSENESDKLKGFDVWRIDEILKKQAAHEDISSGNSIPGGNEKMILFQKLIADHVQAMYNIDYSFLSSVEKIKPPSVNNYTSDIDERQMGTHSFIYDIDKLNKEETRKNVQLQETVNQQRNLIKALKQQVKELENLWFNSSNQCKYQENTIQQLTDQLEDVTNAYKQSYMFLLQVKTFIFREAECETNFKNQKEPDVLMLRSTTKRLQQYLQEVEGIKHLQTHNNANKLYNTVIDDTSILSKENNSTMNISLQNDGTELYPQSNFDNIRQMKLNNRQRIPKIGSDFVMKKRRRSKGEVFFTSPRKSRLKYTSTSPVRPHSAKVRSKFPQNLKQRRDSESIIFKEINPLNSKVSTPILEIFHDLKTIQAKKNTYLNTTNDPDIIQFLKGYFHSKEKDLKRKLKLILNSKETATSQNQSLTSMQVSSIVDVKKESQRKEPKRNISINNHDSTPKPPIDRPGAQPIRRFRQENK